MRLLAPLRVSRREPRLEHDAEKCEAVFHATNARRLRADHAQSENQTEISRLPPTPGARLAFDGCAAGCNSCSTDFSESMLVFRTLVATFCCRAPAWAITAAMIKSVSIGTSISPHNTTCGWLMIHLGAHR